VTKVSKLLVLTKQCNCNHLCMHRTVHHSVSNQLHR
jgi:hypothetical protein